MLTKGYIVEIPLNDNKYKVRVPFYENAVENSEEVILTATLSQSPGIVKGYSIGDCVYLSFEDNDISRPVIIGKLLNDTGNIAENIKATNLEVSGKVVLPQNTSIGGVTPENIRSLIGNTNNLKWQIEESLSNKGDVTKEDLEELKRELVNQLNAFGEQSLMNIKDITYSYTTLNSNSLDDLKEQMNNLNWYSDYLYEENKCTWLRITVTLEDGSINYIYQKISPIGSGTMQSIKTQYALVSVDTLPNEEIYENWSWLDYLPPIATRYSIVEESTDLTNIETYLGEYNGEEHYFYQNNNGDYVRDTLIEDTKYNYIKDENKYLWLRNIVVNENNTVKTTPILLNVVIRLSKTTILNNADIINTDKSIRIYAEETITEEISKIKQNLTNLLSGTTDAWRYLQVNSNAEEIINTGNIQNRIPKLATYQSEDDNGNIVEKQDGRIEYELSDYISLSSVNLNVGDYITSSCILTSGYVLKDNYSVVDGVVVDENGNTYNFTSEDSISPRTLSIGLKFYHKEDDSETYTEILNSEKISNIHIRSGYNGRSIVTTQIPANTTHIMIIVRASSSVSNTAERYSCAMLEKGQKASIWGESENDYEINKLSSEVVSHSISSLDITANGIKSTVAQNTKNIGNPESQSENLILLNTVSDETVNGVTITINNNIITLNGTSTSDFEKELFLTKTDKYGIIESEKTYNLQDLGNNTLVTCRLKYHYNDSNYKYLNVTTTATSVSFTNNGELYSIILNVSNGQTFDNTTINPSLTYTIKATGLYSQISQTANDITFSFGRQLQDTEDKLSGDLQDYKDEVGTFIRFQSDENDLKPGIVIGESKNTIQSLYGASGLFFMKGADDKGYIYNTTFNNPDNILAWFEVGDSTAVAEGLGTPRVYVGKYGSSSLWNIYPAGEQNEYLMFSKNMI